MSDVLKPQPERPTPEQEAQAWLDDLGKRVDSVKDLPDADVLITGTVISRIGGDSVNGGFPFIARAETENGITPEFYQRAINGFKVTWLEVEGAIENHKDNLPENVKDYFEKDIIEKHRPTFEKIIDPGFDPNELNSLFQGEAKDFLMETQATQKVFGEEITKAIKSPGFYRKLLF